MYKLIKDISELDFNPDAYVYLDTETLGLYGKIKLVQMYQSHWDKVAIADTQTIPLETIARALANQSVVLHNAHYDLTCFDLEGCSLPNWDCTLLASRLAMPHLESFSLDSCFCEVLGFNPYDDLISKYPEAVRQFNGSLFDDASTKVSSVKKKLQSSNWENPKPLQYLYAAVDVFYMPKLVAKVVDKFYSQSYKLDKKAISSAIIFQRCGLPVDREKHKNTKKETEDKLASLTAELSFNPNSSAQVQKALGVASSADKELALLEAKGNTTASKVREYRRLSKQLSFLKDYDAYRVYGFFNFATKSGRSNCTDLNLQQIPSSLKHIFGSDKYLVYADFSNLELRTFAGMVGEKVMASKFANNEDLHSYSATQLFNLPLSQITKEQRQIAKVFNFSSLYGAGVKTRLGVLTKMTGIVLDEVQGSQLADNWIKAYPDVAKWHELQKRRFYNDEEGVTALGRNYRIKQSYPSGAEGSWTEFCNIQIQGTGADIAKLALAYMSKTLDLSKLCVFVHDSYTFECDTLYDAKHYAEALASCMQLAWYDVSKNFSVKVGMPVEAVIAQNWADAQNDKNIIHKVELKG